MHKFFLSILMQIRPNPDYVRITGSKKRIGKWIYHSAPELILPFRGEWRELNMHAITATGTMSKR